MLSSRFAVAVHVLAVHCLEPDRALTSDYVAGSVNTNPVVVRRLLGRLRRAGLVRVQPGPRGGSRLARTAGAIRLVQVFRAVEGGGLLALHRGEPNPRCPVGRNIRSVLGDVFAGATRAFEGALRDTTLADVARVIRRRAERSAAGRA